MMMIEESMYCKKCKCFNGNPRICGRCNSRLIKVVRCQGCSSRPAATDGYCKECGSAKVYAGFTQKELGEAFNLVKPKRHWKDRINIVIAKPDRKTERAILAAVAYFTGSVADMEAVGKSKVRVRAGGYWAVVGA
jgi:hypothetical protein